MMKHGRATLVKQFRSKRTSQRTRLAEGIVASLSELITNSEPARTLSRTSCAFTCNLRAGLQISAVVVPPRISLQVQRLIKLCVQLLRRGRVRRMLFSPRLKISRADNRISHRVCRPRQTISERPCSSCQELKRFLYKYSQTRQMRVVQLRGKIGYIVREKKI